MQLKSAGKGQAWSALVLNVDRGVEVTEEQILVQRDFLIEPLTQAVT